MLKNDGLMPATYYYPAYRNLRSIDSFFVLDDVLYLLQITISNDHDIIHQGLKVLMKMCNFSDKKSFLVFVVPEAKYHSMKEQKLTQAKSGEPSRSRNFRPLQRVAMFDDPLMRQFERADLKKDE